MDTCIIVDLEEEFMMLAKTTMVTMTSMMVALEINVTLRRTMMTMMKMTTMPTAMMTSMMVTLKMKVTLR